MPKQVTIAEAREQLSAHVRSAEHGMPVVITRRGRADADLQIAATALHHDLELVTGNLRHFGRIPGRRIRPLHGAT